LEICHDLLRRFEIGLDFLNKVITGDESWVFEYDPDTKGQSAEWHTKSSPLLEKGHMSRSRVKIMIIGFSKAMALCTKNLYLQGRHLITPSTKMSWNEFEKCLASPTGHCTRLGAAKR
jgi:hypothetical protein